MKKVIMILICLVIVSMVSSTVIAYETELMDYGEVDFEGETVTFIGMGKPDLFEDPEEDEYGKYPHRIDDAKEKFNIGEIVWEKSGWDEAGEIALNRIMADDSDYDVYILREFDAIGMMAKGSLFPVSDILPSSYFENIHPQTKKLVEKMEYNGKHYSFSNYFRYKTVNGFFFNLDIIEEAGLENPYDLYEDGEWTWEKFADMAEKLTQDTDNDGEVDQWGIDNLPYDRLVYSNGASIIEKVDGEYKVVIDSEESLETFEFMTDINDIIGGEWSNELFVNGQAAFSTGELFHLDKSFEFEYGVLPFPKGPSGEQDAVPVGNIERLYLPVNSEKPKEIVALCNYLFPNSYVEDNIDKEVKRRARDKKTAESLTNMLNSTNFDNFIFGYYFWSEDSVWSEVYEQIYDEGESASKVVQEIKPEWQAIIEDVLSD